ncbi:MAG: tetratricopeptide repeat protein [Bacteroidia bacterium]
MKKTITLLFAFFTTLIMAQSNQVLNSFNYLKNKDYAKAKEATDLAAVNESTKGSAKMWMYRGNVYRAISEDKDEKVRNLDPEAEEKALEAYINCLKIDAKDNIYKEDVKGPIVVSAAATSNKANWYIQNKQYDKALHCYDLIETALPYDFDQGMKRNNLTKEKLLFNKFDMYKRAVNKEKTIEYGDKLIAINYKDPKIYSDIAKLYLFDKDTVKSLSYIEKGKSMFEDNMDLTNLELNIYLAQKKTGILKDKLNAAIEQSPDNEVLHFVLANLYKETKDYPNAEKEYTKTLDLKPDYEPANYNLGVLYYTLGKEWNDKLNNLPPKDPKTKEYEKNKDDNFRKAVTYLEKSYTAVGGAQTKQILRQLLLRLGETEKADKYK